MIVFRPGVCVSLRPDGSVRITEPGCPDTVHKAGTLAAWDYIEATGKSNLRRDK